MSGPASRRSRPSLAPSEAGLEIARHLRARLIPVALIVTVLLSVTAPVAYYYVGIRELRIRATALAGRIAELVGREARERPTLWRYDTLKLVAHARSVRGHGDVEGVADLIEVADAEGAPLGLATARELERLEYGGGVWGMAMVPSPSGGAVWVGVSSANVERRTVGLFAVFSVLALLLGALIYAIPRRAALRAGARIDGLVSALSARERKLRDWNRRLEHEVRARSRELVAKNDALARKEAELRELSARAVIMQEDDRRAIARDLHDSVGQVLAAVRINLQLLREHVADDAGLDFVDKAMALTDGTVEEVRRAVERLGPAVVDEVGLSAALARACEDLRERARLAVQTDIEDVSGSPAVERAVYRIAQEALTNVARHAGASTVVVRLSTTVETSGLPALVLEVEDDGRGIAREARARKGVAGGHGIRGMRERALLLGGTFEIKTRDGAGTRVKASIPRGASPD